MKKIISIFLIYSLLFSTVSPAYAELLQTPVQGSVFNDIDPWGSWGDRINNRWNEILQTAEEVQQLKAELDSFVESINQTSSAETFSEADLKKQFKQAYLAELAGNQQALEEEFGTPLPQEITDELTKLRKETEIEKAWREHEEKSAQELALMGNLIFQLYDKPGYQAEALEYMYTLFPSIASGMKPEDKARGLAIMRDLVNKNAASCREVGSWTGIKAFFGKTADLTDKQTKCEQALAAVQILPLLGDFSRANSDDVKAVSSLLAEGFNGLSSILVVQSAGGILLETGRTDALAGIMLEALGIDGASYGLLFADYTPDFTSVVTFFAEGGNGFSKGLESSYYKSPVNSNHRNVWTDLGRAWGMRGRDANLNKVLDAAIKSKSADDVKFKPFVVGVLSSGYIYKSHQFTRDLAKDLFMMSKGDLSPYTATYMENLLAVAYHKAGGVDEDYNKLVAAYDVFPPLNQENHWTCSADINIPEEAKSVLPERVVCQWKYPSSDQYKEEQLKIVLTTCATILDTLVAIVSFGTLAGVAVYKFLAGAGKLVGQGSKWANAALKLYRQARAVWLRSKLVRITRKVERTVSAGIAKTVTWVIVKPTRKFHEVLRRVRASVRVRGVSHSSGWSNTRFAQDFVFDVSNNRNQRRFLNDLLAHVASRHHGTFNDLGQLAAAAKQDLHLRRTIASFIHGDPDAPRKIVKSWTPVSITTDPARITKINDIVRNMHPPFGDQFVDLLVKYEDNLKLREFLGDYVFMEMHNGKLVLSTECKMGEIINELDGSVPNFVQESLNVSNVSANVQVKFRVGSHTSRSGRVVDDFQTVAVGDVDAFMRTHPQATFDSYIPDGSLTNEDKALRQILQYGNLDSRMFLDLTAQATGDAEANLKLLRKSMNDFTPEVEHFLSKNLPTGSKYRIRYNYRMVEHEVHGGVNVIPSSNIHMHLEVYVDDYDVLYNFNIPVKVSDAAADNLRAFHANWPDKVPWYNKLAASRYNNGESILMEPSNAVARRNWSWGGALLGIGSVAAFTSLVADDDGFYEDAGERTVGEQPTAVPADSVPSVPNLAPAVSVSDMLPDN